jgi:hypothetical protein
MKCDFCSKGAFYDGKTQMGPWAYMCKICFIKYGVGLGLGKGQELKEVQKMKRKMVIDEIELGEISGEIRPVAWKGRMINKNKIVELDKLCYRQILIDLDIDLLGVER